MIKIVLDTFGADLGEEELIKGALNSSKNHNIKLILVGNQTLNEKAVKKYNLSNTEVEYINTLEYISNNEEPALGIRKKKNSSMVLGMEAVKQGIGDGFISCGNTGALLAGATFITGRIKNVNRASLSAVIPSLKGGFILSDVGANVDCTPEFLKNFAIMSNIYAKKVLNKENPKVYLLNVGDEDEKGNKLTKDTFELLKNENINFCGNIEARDMLYGKADVIITDGFAGNIALKSTEGAISLLLGQLKEGIMKTSIRKLGALLLKPVFNDIKVLMDYREYGGAPILGVKNPVFKAHGNSNARAVETGINAMIKFIEEKVIEDIIKYKEEENV